MVEITKVVYLRPQKKGIIGEFMEVKQKGLVRVVITRWIELNVKLENDFLCCNWNNTGPSFHKTYDGTNKRPLGFLFGHNKENKKLVKK